MGRPTQRYDDYDERLLEFITEYTREVGVPPTIDTMIERVEGKSSKSTLFYRLQKMVDAGYLTQKNIKGYYYPVALEDGEVRVPKALLVETCKVLTSIPEGVKLSSVLYSHIEKTEG